MSDAARHIGPGGGALRRNQIGDVVERHHIAAAIGALLARHLHTQIAHRGAAVERGLAAGAAHRFLNRTADQGGKFRHGL